MVVCCQTMTRTRKWDQITFDFSNHQIESLVSCHVACCVLTSNEIPAFVGDVTRFRTRHLVSNQFRDTPVHSVHVKMPIFNVLWFNLGETGVEIPELSLEQPSMHSYETEPVVIWVRGS